MNETIKCDRCRKPLYPISLMNKDRETWCKCYKIGVSDSWSGYVDRKSKFRYEGKRR